MSFVEDGYAVLPIRSSAGAKALLDGWQLLGAEFGFLEVCTQVLPERHKRASELLAHIPRRIIEAELPAFQALIGADIRIQKRPFLRISRPGVEAGRENRPDYNGRGLDPQMRRSMQFLLRTITGERRYGHHEGTCVQLPRRRSRSRG